MNNAVLFRCDAMPELGSGHLMRCLALAETLAWAGWEPVFATNPDAVEHVPALLASGYRTIEVDSIDPPAALASDRYAAIIIDHYGRDRVYEQQLAKPGQTVVVMDDLGDRPHQCNILVDPAPDRLASDYQQLVPPDCLLLLGSHYAIVRGAWRRLRAGTRERLASRAPVRRIVVSMGATDPHDATSRVLQAIATTGFSGQVDVVLGKAAPHAARVSELCGANVTLHIEPPNLIDVVAAADLAIGAPGSSSFERSTLGIPAILIPTAANQRFTAGAFARHGAAEVLDAELLDRPVQLGSYIARLIEDNDRRALMSQAAAALTDGRGAMRILVALSGTAMSRKGHVWLRLAEPGDDKDWLFDLQQHPETRKFAHHASAPSQAEHDAWFEAVVDNPERLLMLVMRGHERLGMVRLDKMGQNTFEISIAIAPAYHGEKVGSASLALVRRMVPGASIAASILPENAASMAMFAAAGYRPSDDGHYWNRADND